MTVLAWQGSNRSSETGASRIEETSPRFGIWAPYRGKWVIDARTERVEASFDQAREVTLRAERSGFDTILFAEHTVNPLDQNEEILEAWTAAAAAAALTQRIVVRPRPDCNPKSSLSQLGAGEHRVM
jgi:hypothetical protein